ncbi:SIMPL domain-containing protein [Nocardioides psychrotolerans]|uniref:SIMPL domain-containing protein n=1 Tax=Nocardioides psychrotolerans TaxID=1005945 RepID=UPI00313780F4
MDTTADTIDDKTPDRTPDKTIALSTTGLLVAALAVLALVVAYLLGGSGGTPVAQAVTPVPTAEGADAAPRTLTMSGVGEATAVPDQVTFDLSVRMKRPELDEALDAASRTMTRVLAALEAEGVERKDVQTTGLEMYPVYDYPRYSPPVLTGYRVTQRAAVLVRELRSAGGAVSAAIDAGGNAARVGDIALKIGDPEAALGKARRLAVEEATLKAQEYAEATGQELGAVMTLREVEATSLSAIDERPLAYEMAAAFRSSADSAPLPVSAGRADLGVTVQVVWELAA